MLSLKDKLQMWVNITGVNPAEEKNRIKSILTDDLVIMTLSG